MKRTLTEDTLPTALSPFEAVEAAYPTELENTRDALLRGLPVLVECDKELTPYFYRCLRDRLKKRSIACTYLDGRPRVGQEEAAQRMSLVQLLVQQLKDAVRGSVQERVVVLPHLDLMTTSSGGLSLEAREVIPLMYENPTILWLAFKDPSFPLPAVIERLFPHRESILGVRRERLHALITQREARKFGRELDPYSLYKHVSGVNAVRLRRVLSTLEGEDFPATPERALRQIRRFTLGAKLTVPEVDLHRDIGGYARVKERLQKEILDVLTFKEQTVDEEAIRRVEKLVPRGMVFWGPPGTGKTLFAKAMATALGAAVIVVSGPELKSRWVGESEENLREIFVSARKSAPAVIVFDELDSFAAARGTYTGSGVEHSMVNQLLTEMDGFRSDELVFVVGTTNFVESLDAALLRPGRFEFHLEIPYPDAADRLEILKIHDRAFGLKLESSALDFAVKSTRGVVERASSTRYTGDHLQALCRQLARTRLRENWKGSTDVAAVEAALSDYHHRPQLTHAEELVVATHEAGHAVCALHCEHAPPIDRISIRGDFSGGLGFVVYGDPAQRYVTTHQQLLDEICVLYGGREAESLLLDDVSIGATADLEQATHTARALVEELGLGHIELGVRRFVDDSSRPELSERTRRELEDAVRGVLETQRQRAADILKQHESSVKALRQMLLDHQVIDRRTLAELTGATEDSSGAEPKPQRRRPSRSKKPPTRQR